MVFEEWNDPWPLNHSSPWASDCNCLRWVFKLNLTNQRSLFSGHFENRPERAGKRMFQSEVCCDKSVRDREFKSVDFIRNERNVQIVHSVFRSFYQESINLHQLSLIPVRWQEAWFVDTCLYIFRGWNCTLIQTIVKTEMRHSSLVKCFSYVPAVGLVYIRQGVSLQQPIFQQDRLSFRESVSLLFWDNPRYLTTLT